MRREKLTWAAVGLAVGILANGAVVLASKWWPETHTFDTIEARGIKIVDAEGRNAAILTADDGGGGRLIIYDAKGREAAELSTYEGGYLTLSNAEGREAVRMSAYEGGGRLTIYDAEGRLSNHLH